MVAGNKVTGKIHISWGSHYLFDIYSLLFTFLRKSPTGIHARLKPLGVTIWKDY